MDYQELGLWDAIFNLGEMKTRVWFGKLKFGSLKYLFSYKELCPLLSGLRNGSQMELRRLGLAKEDVRITKLEDEIVLDPENPIENVSWI